MTILLPKNHHAQQILEANRVTCIPPEQAEHQDIRPMRIGILNIMPFVQSYEFNLLHPLGLSIIQVDPIWIKLESHSYKSSKDYIEEIYITYEQAIKDAPLDGLIVTGAPVEKIQFEQVQYWNEISSILADAKFKCPSTLGICWGGFALAYLEGIEKFTYHQKLIGVFELANINPQHPITGELDDRFWCPQSRHAGIEDHVMEQAQKEGKLNLLAYGKESGYSIFETPDHRFIIHIGHPEYHSSRLVAEYQRDLDDPEVPVPSNFDIKSPINRWRGHRNMFFGQWLKYCYTEVSV